MAEPAESIANEIDRIIDATVVPGSPNTVESSELREWALEYLDCWDEEVDASPELRRQPHWNLWANDASWDDALFVVLFFGPSSLTFFCGTGYFPDVRDFSMDQLSDDAEGLYSAMPERFRIVEEAWEMTRDQAKAWLGRSW